MKLNWTVFVVDDDPFYRALYASQLKQIVSDVRVQTADNGERALALLNNSIPDLVILDLKMPKMDGKAFLTQLAEQHLPTPPTVLAVSAHDDESRSLISTNPSILVLTKPLRADAFEQVIRLCLNQRNRPALRSSAPVNPGQETTSLVDFGHMNLYIGANPNLQTVIATQFYNLAPDRIAEAALAARCGDFNSLLAFCHAMEASAATIGAHQVAKICRRLKYAAKDKNRTAVDVFVLAFSQALRSYCVELSHAFSLGPA